MTALTQAEFSAPLSANAEYRQAFASGLMPDPLLTMSEWADEHRMLDSKGSPEPGKWRTARTPYLREIMDNLSLTSDVIETDVMKGAQLGFTEAGNNLVGYVIDHAPGPGLFLEPSQDLANRNVRQKINPMLLATPSLASKVPAARSKEGGNTLEEKEFPGGIWLFKWASSTAGLRSASIRFLVLDEIDEYAVEVGQQGDPEGLARKRTNAYGRRKKIFVPSTPTVSGHSRIETLFESGDMRYYMMPCPCCRELIRFEFKQLKWEAGKPHTVYYECQACTGRVEHWQKTAMLEAGQWVPTAEGSPTKRTYHINSLYSPVGWQSWEEIVQEWEDAQGNPAKLKVFVNTVLAETWKDKGEAPDWQRLYNRRENYPLGVVPMGGLILTAAADVQRGPGGGENGWIEVVLYAWGRNLERWVVDHQQFHGDTSNLDGKAWKQLEEWYGRHWPHEHAGVAMPIRKLAVDSSDQTTTVYQWVAAQPADQVMAVKGKDVGDLLVQSALPIQIKADGKKRARATKLWRVSLNIAKPELYAQLRYELDPEQPTPRGYIHFPELDEEFFKQLTGEQLVFKRDKKGKVTSIWEKTRPRVEVLDCTVYAMAAAYMLRLYDFREENWSDLEKQLGIGVDSEPVESRQNVVKRKPKRESFWRNR